MSRARITPELARLFARDIKEAGGPVPAHADRWSRTEVAAIETWMRTSPWYAEARRSGRGDRYLGLALDVGQYFRNDHPADPGGAPAPWPRTAFVPVDDAANAFAGASPEVASAYLAYAQAHPIYSEAMRDPKHPQHAALMEQTRMLRRIAASAPDTPEPIVTKGEPGDEPARRDAIAQLQRDEAYLNRTHPQHAEAVARMAALYDAGTPLQRGNSATENPQDIISRIRNDDAYLNKRHPDHARRVAEMQRAYEAAQPAAAGTDTARPGSASAAQDTIGRIRGDAAYWDKHHPDHATRVAEMQRAHEAAYPPPPAPAEGGDHAA